MDTKTKRMTYLAEVIRKYQNTEPSLSLKEIAIILIEEVEDVSTLLKVYKRELKK